MIENIREKSQGTIAKVILGFVILTFAIAGVGSYTNSVDTSVAHVNGEKISQRSYEQAYQAQKRRMQQQFGQMFDTLSADANYMANFRQGVLENLINEKLLDQNAAELAIRVSDERIKNTIRQMPEFQVDGKFDNNRYLALINQAGFLQSSDFRDYLRVEMTRRQLSQALVGTEFALPYQTELMAKLNAQTRDIRYAIIKAAQFNKDVTVSDEEVSQYYHDNSSRFETQEQVKVEYVTLDLDKVKQGIEVDDKAVQEYYQQNIANYTDEEQRRLSHILIEFGDDEAKAKQQAEKLLTEVKSGADFAKLAKQNSADTLSAENGGDLDWVAKGQMDEAFEKAAFALAKVGDISSVVKSSFGFHIIKLTDLKPETIKPLAEVKTEVIAKLKEEKAKDKYFELQQSLSQVAFENPDNLEAAAQVINASIKTSDWIKRFGNTAPFDNSKVIEAAFSEPVLTENVNSDVVEVNDSLALVLRMVDHKEAKVKPLEAVKASIVEELTAKKASEMAQQKVAELVDKINAGENISDAVSALGASFTEQKGLTRNEAKLDRAITQQAFKLAHPQQNKPTAGSANLANGDLAIIELVAVNEGEVKADENLAKRQASQLAQSAYQAYISALQAQADIERRPIKNSDS